jgi:hypothetical protein
MPPPTSLLEGLRALRRSLAAPFRWSLSPLDALDEISSYLPPGPRISLQDRLNEVSAAREALVGPRQLVELSGVARSTAAPLRVLTDLRADAEAYWSDLVFASPPTRRARGALHGWRGLARTFAAHRDIPLVLLRQDRVTRRLTRRLGAFTLPTWTHCCLDLPGSIEEIVGGGPVRGRSSRKSDVRRIRAQGIEAELSRRPEDVLALLREWNEPFIRTRHGASAIAQSLVWQRQAPRFCEVLWIHRRGERLGGLLLEPRGSVLRLVVLGVRDDAALREGAVAALYYHALREALRRGFTTVDFGGSHPVLSDGVLAYKRKWGVSLAPCPRWDYVALRLAPQHPFTRAFLAEHPLIVETDGGLRALTGEPGPSDTGLLAEQLTLPGLRGRIIPQGEAWIEAPLPTPQA